LVNVVMVEPANGLNDYTYLKWVFSQIPAAADVQQLLPWNVNAAELGAQLKQPS
jgi:hypothetical protein